MPEKTVEWKTDHIVVIALYAADKKRTCIVLNAVSARLVERGLGGKVVLKQGFN